MSALREAQKRLTLARVLRFRIGAPQICSCLRAMQRKLNVADASTREVHTRSASTILTTASAQERYLALQVAMQDVGIDADCATLRCPAQIHQVLAAEFSRPSPSPSQEGSRSVGGIFADSEDASTCTQLCSDALTSRDHTPSPSLLQPSTSSSARASPTLPPQSVHFADQDTQRLPPQVCSSC